MFNITLLADGTIKGTAAAVISLAWIIIAYAALPLVAKTFFGFLGTIAGAVNDRSRGGFDRLKKFRGDTRSQRYQDAKQNKGGYIGANAAGAVYRRATLGGNPLTKKGRAKYNAAYATATRGTADEAIKNDNGFAAGNDDFNRLVAQDGMTGTRAVQTRAKQLMDRQGYSQSAAIKQAQQERAEFEVSTGTQVGSGTAQVVAYKFAVASNKGYNEDADGNELTAHERQKAIYGDAKALVDKGLLSLSDAAAITKSNPNRVESAGVGFGNAMKAVSMGRDITPEFSNELSDEVLDHTDANTLLRARPESIKLLAPRMAQRIQNISQTGSSEDFQAELSRVANMLDEVGRAAPAKATIVANELMTAKVTDNKLGYMSTRTVKDKFTGKESQERFVAGIGDEITIRSAMERARQVPENKASGEAPFKDRRREYGDRDSYDQANRRPGDPDGEH
jgi:hypothetical protein